MNCYISNSTCPYLNLSYENWLLENLKNDEKILFLYSNRPSVVYGRFQNPYLECNISEMLESKINFVRRQSGGGCVYHDLGNLNVSFIQSKSKYDKNLNNEFILEKLNIEKAKVNNRSDLVLELNDTTYKFSGSAFKEKKDRAIHHLTLLFDSNLSHLNKFITTSLKNIDSKSTKSKRSVVLNLKDFILKDDFINRVILDANSFREVSEEELKDLLLENPFYKQMISKEWIFKETPKFTYQHEYYEFEYKKGKILKFEFNDSFHPALNDQLKKYLEKDDLFENILNMISKLDGVDYYERDLKVIKDDLANFLQVYLFKI